MRTEAVGERRSLSSLRRTRSKLMAMRAQRKREMHAAEAEMIDAEKRLKQLEAEILELEHTGQETIVSDHAIVRYYQRIKGVDTSEAEQAILELPPNQVTQIGRIIVTVLPAPKPFNTGEEK